MMVFKPSKKFTADWHKRGIIENGYSEKDFLNLPSKVMFVQLMGAAKIPIGSKIYEEAITEYPEHFPEEAEHRRKWNLIPKEVHDKYLEECTKMRALVYKDAFPSPSLLGAINNTEEYQKWKADFDRLRPDEIMRERLLHEKYYTPYGIKYFEE